MDNPEAFPIEWKRIRPEYLRQYGMTLRDYFAGQALVSLSLDVVSQDYTAKETASAAYTLADAMLAQRGEK